MTIKYKKEIYYTTQNNIKNTDNVIIQKNKNKIQVDNELIKIIILF